MGPVDRQGLHPSRLGRTSCRGSIWVKTGRTSRDPGGRADPVSVHTIRCTASSVNPGRRLARRVRRVKPSGRAAIGGRSRGRSSAGRHRGGPARAWVGRSSPSGRAPRRRPSRGRRRPAATSPRPPGRPRGGRSPWRKGPGPGIGSGTHGPRPDRPREVADAGGGIHREVREGIESLRQPLQIILVAAEVAPDHA